MMGCILQSQDMNGLETRVMWSNGILSLELGYGLWICFCEMIDTSPKAHDKGQCAENGDKL